MHWFPFYFGGVRRSSDAARSGALTRTGTQAAAPGASSAGGGTVPAMHLLALALLCAAAAQPGALGAQDICPTSVGEVTVEGVDGSTATATTTSCPGDQTAPVISTEPHNGDHLQPGMCAAGCFEALVAYSTPAYVILDQPHSATLAYRSGRARPRPLVQVDVTDTSTIAPTRLSIRMQNSSGVAVTFTNGLQEIFYTYPSALKNRVSAQFDASSLATGAYDYTVMIRSWWSDGSFRESSAPVRVLVVNDAGSYMGAGWWLLGLQRVHLQANGSALVTDGTGAAAYFHRACTSCGFTRPRGDFSTLTYDGTYYRRRYPDGTELVFYADGRQYYARDRVGNQTTYVYHPSGKLNYIADALGAQTAFGYDAGGRLAWLRDPAGRYSYVTVNSAGDLTHIKDASNTFVLQATYDAQHRMVSRIDAAGGSWKFAYDAFGKLAADSMPAVPLWDGRTVRPTVRYRSLEAAVLPASGGTSTNPAPGVDASAVRASVTTPRGAVTQIAVDRWGAATRAEGPTGHVDQAFRNAEGQDTLVLTALGDSLRYAWSGPNLTNASSARAGTVNAWSYESTYNQVQEASGTQAYRFFFYNSRGLPDSIKVGSASAAATRLAYDSYGRVTEQIDPEQHQTVYAYGSTGSRNLQSVTTIEPAATGLAGIYPDDQMVNDTVTRAVYTYDGYGRVQTVKNAFGDTTRPEYDVVNRVVRTVGPRGDATSYGYNALGLSTVTDARNQVYTYRRNALGWVYEQVDPRNAVQSFAFDENGNVRGYVNRRGQTATWEYDVLDRQTRQTADGRVTQTSYSPDARLMVVQTPESTDSIRVDALGRTTEVVTRRKTVRLLSSGAQPDTMSYRTSAQYGHGDQSVRMTMSTPFRHVDYNADGGLLKSLVDVAGGTTTPSYNADRQASVLQMPTGLQAFRRYGDEHRATSITYTPELDTLGASYEYDLAGRLRQKSPGGSLQPYVYGYDAAGQLTSISRGGLDVETFAYDLVGNPTDHGSVVQTGNRLTSFRGFTLSYDADGNLVRKVGNGVDQTLYWSTLGQLDSVQINGATYRYGYDGLGRRIRKENPWNGSIDFVYWLDGDMLLQERVDGGRNVLRDFSYYPGVDRPHSFRDSTGAVFYFVTDELGNVVGAFNSSNQVVNRFAYSAFGELTERIQGAPGPLRYAAREHDAETGLYFNRARYYDPQLRRFISEDPIGLAGGINPYTYVGNDPVNRRDPSGLIPCEWYWIVSGGLVNMASLVFSGGCDDGDRLEDRTGDRGRIDGVARPDGGGGSLVKKAAECAGKVLGVETIAGVALVAAGQPVVPKRFRSEKSSHASSVASVVADAILGDRTTPNVWRTNPIDGTRYQRPISLRMLVGGPGTGTPLRMARTTSWARFAGRAVPFVGWAMLGIDAVQFGMCLAD